MNETRLLEPDTILANTCFKALLLFDQYESGKDNKMDHIEILPVIQNNNKLATDNNEEFIINNNKEFVANKYEEFVNDNNNNKLIKKLHADIETLYFRNIIDLNNYINYLGENDMNEVLDN
ncbi:15165_t:CDS:2 [Dentiscutata erythropus]|uniref:15165_t:CDS:1 n=1 Tax=Dentiscutata erythropus TaxID=1348616 RepID=A0A9N9JGH4_9GLOM|nr:15165_t:CDS:2 [Dentiscutata erythropus]